MCFSSVLTQSQLLPGLDQLNVSRADIYTHTLSASSPQSQAHPPGCSFTINTYGPDSPENTSELSLDIYWNPLLTTQTSCSLPSDPITSFSDPSPPGGDRRDDKIHDIYANLTLSGTVAVAMGGADGWLESSSSAGDEGVSVGVELKVRPYTHDMDITLTGPSQVCY